MANLVQIIFPGLVSSDFALLKVKITELEIQGLVILSYVLALKAQISACCSNTLSTKEIQMLDTQKYLAKVIANNHAVRSFISKIVIQRTIGWEAARLKTLSLPLEDIEGPIIPNQPDISPNLIDTAEKRIEVHLSNEADLLAEQSPPRGATILPIGQVNASNLKYHRYGIMAQITGFFQSKSVFEPHTIIKGATIYTVDMELVHQALHNTLLSLGLLDDSLTLTLDQFTNHLKEFVKDENLKSKVFYDDAFFGGKNNLLPLEEPLEYTRPIPTKGIILEIPEGSNPILKMAIEASNLRNQEIQRKEKAKPASKLIAPAASAKTAATPTPPPASPPAAKKKRAPRKPKSE